MTFIFLLLGSVFQGIIIRLAFITASYSWRISQLNFDTSAHVLGDCIRHIAVRRFC